MRAIFLLLLFIYSCGGDNDSDNNSAQEEEAAFDLEVLTQRSDVVWGFDFLQDGRILFSERRGALGVFDPATTQVTSVTGAPAVFAQGEGGLLDLRVQGNEVYLCYAHPTGGNFSTTSLGKGTLSGNTLTNFSRIFTGSEPATALNHFGCRIEFGSDGRVFLSMGERALRARAQDPSSNLGKILSMNNDGSDVRVFSHGHRNVQGLTFRPGTEDLWASELGPQGGDELNLIVQGENYGWPVVSNGSDPGGLIETTSRTGFRDPILFWDPSISPSALAFWNGEAFLACLSGQQIRRISFNGSGSVDSQEILFENLGWRFRNLRVGPDGNLYFSTDEGRIGRVTQ